MEQVKIEEESLPVSEGIKIGAEDSSKGVKIEEEIPMEAKIEEGLNLKQGKLPSLQEPSKVYSKKHSNARPTVVRNNNNLGEFPAQGFVSRRPRMIKEVKPSRRLEKEWRVGEEVVAFWETDNIWRLGEIHEIRGGKVQVVASKEVGVKSTFSKINELKPASMPLDLLNAMSI